MIEENLARVEERILAACARSGRSRQEITLVAVTKVFPADTILEAYGAGLRDFGENYVQEFETKAPSVAHLDGARYHLIGHLQSNKTRKAAELFHVIETIDSVKVARRLDEVETPKDVFIEVKLSEEESKYGMAPAGIGDLVDFINSCEHLHLQGLMTMPPWSEDQEQSRPYFRRLRELASRHDLPCLSMGMSNDFEAAIEEGATHIRVGTALFGSRKRN